MNSTSRFASRTCRIWSLLAVAMAFMFAEAANAQVRGGRPRRREGGGREGPPQVEPKDDEKPAPGRQVGWVLRLKAAKEDDVKDDEKLMGFITVKPYAKKSRVLKLRVRRDEDVEVMLGDHKIDLEDLGKVLSKGLHVAASWDFLNDKEAQKKRGGKKVLRKLELVTIEVEGTVKEIGDDGIVIYGQPINKAQWPDYVPDDKPGAMPEEVRKSALKLKLMDDVTKLRTADSDDARLSDFKADDEVRVRVVYAGRKTGILVGMRTKDAGDIEEPPDKGDDGGDRGPQPRGPRPKRPGRRGVGGG